MLESITSFLTDSAPFLAVLYIVYKEYKSGANGIAVKVKDTYKERVEQLEKMVGELQDEHDEHSKQIVRLETQLSEKDKQLERYERIFANRNPDLTKVLSNIEQFMSQIFQQNKHQTSILEKRQTRDKKIDDASVHKTGVPIMIPTDSQEEEI